MAEPLFSLIEGLHWAPSSAPRGQFIAIHDCVDASGAFLVHHFLALFIKADHHVCFVHTNHSKDHYAAVGRKLGVNLNASLEKGNLRVFDGFDPKENSALDAASLLQWIRNEVSMATKPVSILIDDLSAFKWQWGSARLVQFLRCCRALALESQGHANIVVLAHADADSSGTPDDPASPIITLAPVLDELATVTLTVAPLPSGYFKDVHGTISVQRQCQGLDGVYDKATTSFKVLENTIKCFASGGDALRSL